MPSDGDDHCPALDLDRVRPDRAGVRLVATAGTLQDSHLQRPLARANALIRRPPNAPAAVAGEALDLLPIAPF